MVSLLVKRREKKTKVEFPNHTVVNKTTLACTAVYNANAHSEWINLDQSVTKQAITASVSVGKQQYFFLLRMQLSL